jgi:long-subunit acyl-CoA synthetase (AMP-forming)
MCVIPVATPHAHLLPRPSASHSCAHYRTHYLLRSLQDVPSLCRERAVLAAVQHSMTEEGRAAQLRGFEHVAAVTLVPEAFSVENGLLTPTFKLKRPQVRWCCHV